MACLGLFAFKGESAMKYHIEVVYEGSCLIDVEANNEKEAVKEAKRIVRSRMPSIGYADIYLIDVQVLNEGGQTHEAR